MAEEEAGLEGQGEGTEMSIYNAIREVLKKASHNNGLFRGVNEVARAIDRGHARVCFISENCDLNDYKNLLRSLCREKGVPIVNVTDRVHLGEWAGMCKIDQTGNARKVVKCSSAAISYVDEETESWRVLTAYINQERNQA